MSDQINILLADDHQLLLDGLHDILIQEDNVGKIYFATHGKEVLEQVEKHSIDLIFLDLNMPIMNGFETMKVLGKKHTNINVIGLSMIDEVKLIQNFIRQGAKGFMLKNSGKDSFKRAIQVVMNGGFYYDERVSHSFFKAAGTREYKVGPLANKLSKREKQILNLIVQEFKTNEIAEKLNISSGTVETHRRNLIHKTGVRNTAGLVRVALEYSLID